MTRDKTPTVASVPSTAKVEIAIGGLSVSVEAVASLNAVAKKAMELWREANDPRMVSAGGVSIGFAVSEPTTSTLLPPRTDIAAPSPTGGA